MIEPVAVEEGEDFTTIGRVFGTPLVVKGWTWLPLTQLFVWLAIPLWWDAGQSCWALACWLYR